MPSRVNYLRAISLLFIFYLVCFLLGSLIWVWIRISVVVTVIISSISAIRPRLPGADPGFSERGFRQTFANII